MPDVVTHLCTGLLFKGFSGGRYVGPLVVGTLLPDVSSRAPIMVIDAAIRHGAPLPLAAMYPWAVLHMPVGNLALCGLLASLFRRDQRVGVFLWLWLGSLSHFAFDLIQGHYGEGYTMLFPFSTRTTELGLIGSEATIPWVPATVAVTGAIWGWRWWRSRRVARGAPPPYDGL